VLSLRSNLETAGHAVRIAGDGAEALATLRADPPDVLVLDPQVPVVDGWQVLQRLKSDPDEAVRTIPVVVLSALDGEEDQARAGIEGALTYLIKPMEPALVVREVQEVLSGGPEPVQRKAAQIRALQRLARLERAQARDDGADVDGRWHGGPDPTTANAPAMPEVLISGKQRELLRALEAGGSVTAAAETLGVSRANVYARLHRVGRKLDVADVSQLLGLLRAGELATLLDG
jgi:DNA-binding NarL/FixJ family response regulator